LKTFVGVVIVAVCAAASASGAPPDLLKSKKDSAPMTVGVTYQASLFVPHVLIKTTEGGWQGGQHASKSYRWLQLVFRGNDPKRGGGMNIVSAPRSHQLAAKTIATLRTERAASANVGIHAGPVVHVTWAHTPALQFDGTVTGPFGHTFVPFSGKSSGASEDAGDHIKFLRGDVFRVIVTTIHGTPVVFFLDSGGAPQLNTAFLRAAARIVNAMKFTSG
jgi:hypothetical protein